MRTEAPKKLSHPTVDVCLAGPRTELVMEQGLQAIADGPLSNTEVEGM